MGVFVRIVITFLVVVALFSSCTNTDNSVSKEEITLFTDGFIAKVTTDFQDDGCEVLLELEENGERALLLPIDLDEKYKVHGLEVLITYHSSRIMQSTCQNGRPIVIDSIKLIG